MTAPTPRPVLFLVGDSLTQHGSELATDGWVSLLLHRYNRSADIVQRGMSGYNTKWFVEFALPTIKRELSERSPALITLWLGANDAALPDGESAKQHVPLPTYSANLVKIVQSFRDRAPNANLLLITPPHVDDAVRQSFSPTNRAERTNAMAGEYAQACVEVGRKLDVNVLDVYSIFNSMEESERAECLDDGLHFSTKGNALVFRELQTKIHDAFPELEKSLENWQLPNFHIWFD